MSARTAIVFIAFAFAAPIPAVAFDGPPRKDGTTNPIVTPTIHITEPRAGRLARAPERITIYFQRVDAGLNASSLELWIDGVEYTESLRFWVDRAWLDLPAGFWPPGTHLLHTQVQDAVGALHSDNVTFELPPITLGVVYGWPFDYASPNVIGNLMEDYQGFLDAPQDEPYWHHGLDIRAPAHTPVYSVVNGYIAYKGPYLDGGSLQRDISIIGDDDLIWQYNHVNSSTWTLKEVGDPVTQGEFLANIENWPTGCCEVNDEPYHHLHLNAVELEGFDIAAWRAMAEDPRQTPPAIPKPLDDDFKWFNPLAYLTQAGELDNVAPEFGGQQQVAGPEIIFLANNTNDGIEPVANEIILGGDVDILARLGDTRDEIDGLLNPGQPYDVGVYEVSYEVTPLSDQCFKGWIPEKKLATFDVVPGEYDGDDQDALLLDVFQMQFVYDGQTYDTLFDWGVNQRNFWYNVTNTKGGVLNGIDGFWDTDGISFLGPKFADGPYEVTVFARDFAGNEEAMTVEVTLQNGISVEDACPQWITHLAPPPIEAIPFGGGPITYAPAPIPIAFDRIVDGSSHTSIPSASWPPWYFDDPAEGLRVAVGVLDGNHVEVEYVPYLGDVILEIPAEMQELTLTAGGGPPEFDPTAPSTNPVELRMSTRLARDPVTGVGHLGSPHAYDALDFTLVMAETIDVQSFPWRLQVSPTGSASWTLSPSMTNDTPRVPDGTFGRGMTVAKDPAVPDDLIIVWDPTTCGAAGYNLLHGSLQDVSSHTITGSLCGMGSSGTRTWRDVPTEDTYFISASENGTGTEGSWGLDSAGNHRGGSTPSGQCSNTARSNASVCP